MSNIYHTNVRLFHTQSKRPSPVHFRLCNSHAQEFDTEATLINTINVAYYRMLHEQNSIMVDMQFSHEIAVEVLQVSQSKQSHPDPLGLMRSSMQGAQCARRSFPHKNVKNFVVSVDDYLILHPSIFLWGWR